MAKGKRRKAQAAPRQTPERRPWGRYLVAALAVAGVSAGLVAGGLRLADPETLPVETLRVQGRLHRVTPEAVREAVRPHAGDGLLWLDIATTRRAVEALPWVRRARVRRAWPATVAVTVEEQRPLARWVGGGLVNTVGERFAPATGVPAGLPRFAGPAGTAPELAGRYREMRRALSPLGLEIGALGLDARRSWRLTLANGVELLLGRDRHYGRLLRFVRVYSQALAEKVDGIERVDLRYTNGLAVRWAGA